MYQSIPYPTNERLSRLFQIPAILLIRSSNEKSTHSQKKSFEENSALSYCIQSLCRVLQKSLLPRFYQISSRKPRRKIILYSRGNKQSLDETLDAEAKLWASKFVHLRVKGIKYRIEKNASATQQNKVNFFFFL